MQHIKAFLELTKLDESAKLEYEVVETSRKEFSEASYWVTTYSMSWIY